MGLPKLECVLFIQFKSFNLVPFLSKILPSDVCRIYKKGCALRMDSSLLDVNDKSLERGNISFLFNPGIFKKLGVSGRQEINTLSNILELPEGEQFIMLDNNAKTYQKMKNEPSNHDMEEEVDVLMVCLCSIDLSNHI